MSACSFSNCWSQPVKISPMIPGALFSNRVISLSIRPRISFNLSLLRCSFPITGMITEFRIVDELSASWAETE